MSLYDADPTIKQNKKMMRTGMIAAFSGGIGLAIYLMQKAFGGIAPADNMNAMIDSVCLLLIAYMAAIFAVFVIRRPVLLKVNFVLLYLVIPAVLVKLFTEYM
ncbi:MAG: hypothetical protein JWO78_1080 [Micavibrio sp.]|nr:hypothetical protein [Micavibrio sp.]